MAEVTMLRRFTIEPRGGGHLCAEERTGFRTVALAVTSEGHVGGSVVELTRDEWEALGEMVAAAAYSPGYRKGPTVLRDAEEDDTRHVAKETSDDPGF